MAFAEYIVPRGPGMYERAEALLLSMLQSSTSLLQPSTGTPLLPMQPPTSPLPLQPVQPTTSLLADGCHLDGCSGSGGLACARCKRATYCSRICQKKAWEAHKGECSAAAAAPLSASVATTLLPQASVSGNFESSGT